MRVKQVTATEADQVTDLFALAFYEDPTWRWAFPDPARRMEQHRFLWGLIVHSALPHGWVRMTDDGGAAALWIPPGESELGEEDEARVEPFLRRELGAHADAVLALMDSFEANHPHDRPHYYLSLLGTHPDHRGRGKGISCSPTTSARSIASARPPISSRATGLTTLATSGSASPSSASFLPPTVDRRSGACGGSPRLAESSEPGWLSGASPAGNPCNGRPRHRV